MSRLSRWLRAASASAVVCVLAAGCTSIAAAAPARRVLLVYSNGRLLPANVDFERGIRAALQGLAESRIELFEEFLDSPRFEGQAHLEAVTRYLGMKYAAQPPDVIVAGGVNALNFVLGSRSQLFPKAPVVHAVVSPEELQSLAPLPADVVGVPAVDDFYRTVDQALRWHPRASRLVIVTGTSERDRRWEARMRVQAVRFEGRATVEFLAGLPMPDVLERLARLGDDAVVFTPGAFVDGAGRNYWPRDTVAAMAAASRAPLYASSSGYLGTGMVAGYMTRIEDQGRQAGQTVNQLLGGTESASLRLPQLMPLTLNVDWRQVQRWGIDERAVPAEAVVHFRAPSFLEEHRREVMTATAVFLVQAALIGGLLVERRRRRNAELTVQTSRSQLAHTSRLAVAGELTAALAHEINQPLGAILSNADAAELILDSGGDRRDLLRKILGDIRRDDVRASEVISRLRALLQKNEVERQPFAVDDAINDVELVLRAEARQRHVTLRVVPTGSLTTLMGDRIQIQQVLINLLLNAMDAVAQMPEERRTVTVSAQQTPDGCVIEVRDRGPGIAPEHLQRVFDSFFSTKRAGMGLGLSIVRTLVEAHGGRVWAENGPEGGAVFRVELPAHGRPATASRRQA